MSDARPTFKIILIGNTNVGKTALRYRYFGRGFQKQYLMTLGADFALREFEKSYAQIWDLAGQISFQKIRKVYYKGAHGALLVFDLTSKKSFDDLDDWLEELRDHNGKMIPIVLVANKYDLIDEGRAVTEDDIHEYLAEKEATYDVPFFFYNTSAKTGENVNEIFNVLMNEVLNTFHIEH